MTWTATTEGPVTIVASAAGNFPDPPRERPLTFAERGRRKAEARIEARRLGKRFAERQWKKGHKKRKKQ